MSNEILSIKGLEVLDSRGNPTVRAFLKTSKGVFCASVPSGASTGVHEAVELRDGKKDRYNGKGVLNAVKNVNTVIADGLKGKDCTAQQEIDRTLLELDGTPNKKKLGANALLAVSIASCVAGASHRGLELYKHIQLLSGNAELSLPVPQLNVINSGKHAGIDNDVQEHMLLPFGFSSYSESLRAGTEIYYKLKEMLSKKYGVQAIHLGDEGGFAPPISDVRERLDLLMHAISEAGYEGKIKLGIDAASSEFYKDGTYTLGKKKYASGELVDYYKELCKTYPFASIEDGMSEDDWEGWALLNKELGSTVQLVGDDLLVTNVDRIKKAVEERACNALLLKVNQIGTVSESIDAAAAASKQKWNVVVSHRSGETSDTFIADLVVGMGSSQSKFGGPARSDRTSKYNRLLEIESELEKPKFQKL